MNDSTPSNGSLDTPLRVGRLRTVPRGSSRRSRLKTPLLEAQAEVLGPDSIPRPGEAKKFPRGSRRQLELELRLAIARGMRAEGYSLSAVALQLGGGRVNVVRLVRGWEKDREDWVESMEREAARYAPPVAHRCCVCGVLSADAVFDADEDGYECRRCHDCFCQSFKEVKMEECVPWE